MTGPEMSELELDLPLAEQGTGRFLQWILAAATCLAVLAAALAVLADAELRRAAMRPMVVTLALPAGTAAAEVEAVVRFLGRTEGVAFADPVSEEELAQLVEPWLGDLGEESPLAIPRLIDVTFDPGFRADLRELEARLRELVPGTTFDRTAVEPPETGMLRNLRLFALIAAVAFVSSGVVATAAVVRAGLRAQTDTVDLLRLMGAVDRYLEGQLVDHVLRCGLRGAVAGFATAGMLILAGIEIGGRFDIRPFDALVLRPVDWLLLTAVPILLVLLATLAARLAIDRSLARAA